MSLHGELPPAPMVGYWLLRLRIQFAQSRHDVVGALYDRIHRRFGRRGGALSACHERR